MSTFRRLAAGALAGAVGTLAMDLVWYRRYRSGGGEGSFADWSTSSADRFEDASAPGQVGKRIASVVGTDLPEEHAGTTTNVVHWLTGIGYGLSHALVSHRRGVLVGGLLTTATALVNSYAILGAAGIYQPIWEYDRDTLTQDASAHLAFGMAASLAYRRLTRRDEDGA